MGLREEYESYLEQTGVTISFASWKKDVHDRPVIYNSEPVAEQVAEPTQDFMQPLDSSNNEIEKVPKQKTKLITLRLPIDIYDRLDKTNLSQTIIKILRGGDL